jgi:REP element-mobilizing transposase RayT
MTVSSKFERKNIRLPAVRYRGHNFYFVTLCFHNRFRFGANSRVAAWLVAQLRKHSAACKFHVHAYCIMPDHMHVLAAAAAEESNLIKLVESFKQETAFEFQRRSHRRLWQFKYYDRILRAGDAVDRVAWYIWLNPVRQGLCRAQADYPFAGSFTELGTELLRSPVVPDWVPSWKKENRKMPR